MTSDIDAGHFQKLTFGLKVTEMARVITAIVVPKNKDMG